MVTAGLRVSIGPAAANVQKAKGDVEGLVGLIIVIS